MFSGSFSLQQSILRVPTIEKWSKYSMCFADIGLSFERYDLVKSSQSSIGDESSDLEVNSYFSSY